MAEDEENIVKKEKIVWVTREKYGKTVYKDKVLVRHRIFEATTPEQDYLKYYRLARHWAMVKYDISNNDLELFQFLYSEDLFSKAKFAKHCQMFGWDNERFNRFLKTDMIVTWREKVGNERPIYTLSPKAKTMMRHFYEKLEGRSDFSTNPRYNPLFKRKGAKYIHKVMALQILKINAENKARRKKRSEETYTPYSEE